MKIQAKKKKKKINKCPKEWCNWTGGCVKEEQEWRHLISMGKIKCLFSVSTLHIIFQTIKMTLIKSAALSRTFSTKTHSDKISVFAFISRFFFYFCYLCSMSMAYTKWKWFVMSDVENKLLAHHFNNCQLINAWNTRNVNVHIFQRSRLLIKCKWFTLNASKEKWW